MGKQIFAHTLLLPAAQQAEEYCKIRQKKIFDNRGRKIEGVRACVWVRQQITHDNCNLFAAAAAVDQLFLLPFSFFNFENKLEGGSKGERWRGSQRGTETTLKVARQIWKCVSKNVEAAQKHCLHCCYRLLVAMLQYGQETSRQTGRQTRRVCVRIFWIFSLSHAVRRTFAHSACVQTDDDARKSVLTKNELKIPIRTDTLENIELSVSGEFTCRIS